MTDWRVPLCIDGAEIQELRDIAKRATDELLLAREVVKAARIVLPLFQERYANTTKHEGGFDVFGSADKMLTDALERLDEGGRC